jgi:hypothetical protein
MPLWNLPESDMSCSKECTKHKDIAKSTEVEVENALDGKDTSDLKVSFRRAISFSTPPLVLYRNNHCGGYSNLTFGVPLVDLEMNGYKVPKVMRMCIDEVEKRGLNDDDIYWVSLLLSHCFRIHANCRPRRVLLSTMQKYGRPVECTALTNLLADMNSIQLQRRFETERSFSFTSADNIHSVTALLCVSHCNHFQRVDSLSSFLALPLASSRTSV